MATPTTTFPRPVAEERSLAEQLGTIPQGAIPKTEPRRLRRLARQHRVFVALMVVAVLLRVVVTVAYQPVLLYSDSVDYLAHARPLSLSNWHPVLYPLFLSMLLYAHNLVVVAVAQHLLVLGTATLAYLLLLRLGLRPVLAAVACVPALLDAYQVQIEQYVLSEALFEALLVVTVAVLVWRPAGKDGE